jgi:hypothetical protein
VIIQSRVECPCGFQGALKLEQTETLGAVAKCFGCDSLYKEENGELIQVVEQEIPKFETWEEMQAFLNKVPKNSKAVKKRSQPKKKSSAKPDPSKNIVTAERVKDVEIFQTVHFYLRENDSWNNVTRDGHEEKKVRNDNVLVFVHNHDYSDPCSNLCREVLK